MAIIAMLLGGMLFGLAGLVLALPLTATIKVIFDAIPSMEAYGFLIGEPEKEHLKRNSTQQLLIKWGIIRLPKSKAKAAENNAATDSAPKEEAKSDKTSDKENT